MTIARWNWNGRTSIDVNLSGGMFVGGIVPDGRNVSVRSEVTAAVLMTAIVVNGLSGILRSVRPRRVGANRCICRRIVL